jgi:sugar phosphate permease
MTSADAVRYSDLPRAYHVFKWRVLLAFAGFYLFAYFGRFSLYPLGPLVKEGLALSNVEIAVIWAMLFWGFALGDVFHGRLAEAFGLRLWVMLGAVLTAVFNWVTSFAASPLTMAIPLGLAGFVNAACWAPGMSMISQWWPRSRRGVAMGIVGTAAGGAMLVMWALCGWVGSEWGWRAAFRYLPLISAVMGVGFYLLVRDRPSDIGLPEYIEEDEVSAAPEAISAERLRGLGPYRELLSNSRFLLACHVKGMENVVRYGLTTWVAIYYSEAGGLSIESTVFVTVLLPVGYLIAPPLAGFISDHFLNSQRRPLVISSCLASAVIIAIIAVVPPSNQVLGAVLLLAGGVAMGMSPISTVSVDMGGRRMAGTASGLLDAHGYLYAGAQALVFGVVLDMTGSPWPIVFLAMAATRVISVFMIRVVRV